MKVSSIKLILILLLLTIPKEGWAFWVWTPETNKWVNPKYSVKETPDEQLAYAMEFYKQKQYKEAIREFKKLIKHYPRAREAPEAQYFFAKCLEDQDNLYGAFKEYQVVIDKYPFSERSSEIVQVQYDIGNRLLDGIEERNKFIDALSGANYNIIDIFKTVIKNAPYGELAAPSQYKIGLYLLENQLYQEARDEFDKVVNDYPNSEWAKAAKYQIAITDSERAPGSQYDQKIAQSAVAEFQEFVDEYPDAELSKQAKEQIYELREKEAENNFLVAQFYEKQKNFKAARIYYQTVVNDYSDSRWAVKALEKIREVSEKIK